ncbi:related to 16S rRNA processing protein RimM [Desulfotalea psychrophila LSv54]|uniref:Related to 16S rRNA processing protein RimM n=2 Tax=Desulfotalea psychrophila TaxID=84980 RepID=Q6AJE9_DESPS|nr:related to 16S rRNA processing protein RimM [Desulfotalea psychrophila LSv54]
MAITLFETIFDRNRAEHVEGRGVLVARDSLPEIDASEYYWHQLIGKEVVGLDGNSFGKVREMFSNGAQDIMVVSAPNGDEILIPIIADIVVETGEEYIVIDPPEGLINMNET